MNKLYFVRHGQSEMNASGHFAGSTDTPLTKVGIEQAEKAAEKAMDLGIDCIVSSPSSRALETAKIIAMKIGYPVKSIHVNKLLMEQHYGKLEGQPWSPDLDMDGISDLETEDTVLERAKLALEWIKSLEAETILVASHGTFGRALRSLVSPNHTMDSHHDLDNAQIYHWF